MRLCPHCHTEITLKPDPGCPQGWVERLSKLTWCCNRCAGWGQLRSKLASAICRQCSRIFVINEKLSATDEDKRRLDEAHRILTELTKRYARNTCTYLRIMYSEDGSGATWLPDFVDQLSEQPGKAWAILKAYENGLRQLLRLPTTTTIDPNT